MNIYAGSKANAGITDRSQFIDLRSDTVTRPSDAMRAAMAEAIVGDDVYGEDPTVIRLEEVAADLMGKEAGLYLSSGTQSNLTGVLAHCGRGDEIIIGDAYHVFRYEAGGASVLGSAVYQILPVQPDGSIRAEDVAAAIKPDDPHHPVSRLLSLENTVSGMVLSPATLAASAAPARAAGMAVHMDGARLFNAAVSLGCAPRDIADVADTVSICLSKGLGAPVGSVLVGPADLIARARRLRKMLGGGMRQAGILAAAGLYALTENIDSLSEDHRRAAILADALQDMPGIVTDLRRTQSNMLFATLAEGRGDDLREHLAGHEIIVGGGDVVRIVLHRDIDDNRLDRVISAFRGFHNKI